MSEEPLLYKPSEWQQRFHSLTKLGVRHALGAGAAGPGKTTCLLFDAVDQITVEHERCQNRKHKHHIQWGQSKGWVLHLRRTRLQLEQTIVLARRAFVAIDPGVEWNEQKSTFTFTSGLKYQFGHCKDPHDWENYMSFEFCVAKDTPVLMADGSWKAIQSIQAGESVATLEGSRKVTATWDSGIKPCVSVTTSFRGEIVGTQIHPTTHPVLLMSSDESPGSSSASSSRSGRKDPKSELYWQDYESLLGERPESAVKRASEVGYRNGGVTYRGSHLESSLLPTYCVPVALFEPLLARAGGSSNSPSGSSLRPEFCGGSICLLQAREQLRSDLSADLLPMGEAQRSVLGHDEAIHVGGIGDDPTGSGKATGFPDHCFACSRLRDGRPHPLAARALSSVQLRADVEGRAPTSSAHGDRVGTPKHSEPTHADYPHFYTGERRSSTEGYRRGEAEIAFAGFFQTYDLTVEGANHYITSTGLVNAQTAIYFDELTQFNEEQYDQICTRLRTTDPVLMLMLKVRSMSNPLMRKEGTENFVINDPNWVRRRFVDPNPMGNQIFWKKLKMSDGTVERVGSVYMPAKLRDNPDKVFVRQYEATLREQPLHIQKALLEGDWYVTVGSFFAEYWQQALHVCKAFRVPGDWRFFRSMDWGFKAPGCIHWFALDDDDTLYVIKELKFKGKTDSEVAAMVQGVEEELDLWDEKRNESRITGVADTQLWEQRGQSGENMAEVFRKRGVPWLRADKKSRQTNAGHIIKRLTDHADGTKTPGLVFFESCRYIVQTLPAIQTSQHNSEEPQDGGDDHAYDTLAYGCAYASKGKAAIPPKRAPKDEWEDEDSVSNARRRGRHGYGQELC